MIQLVPQLNILLAYEPVDFRKGIDSLVALCKTRLDQDPFSGALFVFRNRSGTALKLLVYDGQGFWLCLKRFSKGRLHWWPQPSDAPLHPLEAQQLSVLLYNGLPEQAGFAAQWRKVDSGSASQAARLSPSSSGSSRA
jgi:transposase